MIGKLYVQGDAVLGSNGTRLVPLARRVFHQDNLSWF
jgi:hypothetical protein